MSRMSVPSEFATTSTVFPSGILLSRYATRRPSGERTTPFVGNFSGGTPTKLPTKGVVLSPDGRRVAYLDSRMPEGKTVLVVANSDGTDMRDITTRQAPNYYWADIR